MKYFIWGSILAGVVMSGCATQGTSTNNYLEPAPLQVKNEIIVDKTYTQVWDGLVKELSKSFYVINNIDKESRIINISFSTNSPSDYVDCGKTNRSYSQGGKTEEYNYEVAASSEFKVATERQEHMAFVNYHIYRREPTLEGRCNIYVAPDDKDSNKTAVTVNTRYILTVRVKGEAFAEHISGNVFSRGGIPEYTTSVIFNTNKPGRKDGGQGSSVLCIGKGKLEEEILQMVGK